MMMKDVTKKSKEEQVEKLINENHRFVESVAKHYLDNGLSYEELVEAGMDGLTVASQNYDPSSGFKFIAYAIWYIKQGILMALKSCGSKEGQILWNQAEERESQIRQFDASLRSGKISEEVGEAICKLPLREMEILLYSFGFGFIPCNDEEICQKLGLTLPQLIQIRCRTMIKLRKQFIQNT